MSQVTSLDDQSPVKPSLDNDCDDSLLQYFSRYMPYSIQKAKLEKKEIQLRNTITHLNKAAMWKFIHKEMPFDKGSIPSKSNCNPARKRNNSKPDKYRNDFFILANASGGNDFIFHLSH